MYFGSRWYGAPGVFAGEALGALLFGVLAMMAAFSLASRLERERLVPPAQVINSL